MPVMFGRKAGEASAAPPVGIVISGRGYRPLNKRERVHPPLIKFRTQMASAKKRIGTKGIAKRPPLSQAEKEQRKERARAAREERKALDERVRGMGMLEYTNYVAEMEREAFAAREEKLRRQREARDQKKCDEQKRAVEKFEALQTTLAEKYEGTAGISCVLCTRFCARKAEFMQNHCTGTAVECQRCELCKEEIESDDPEMHSANRGVLWEEWVDALQTTETRRVLQHERLLQVELDGIRQAGERMRLEMLAPTRGASCEF